MHVFEQHIQWKAVNEVVDRLQANGFQALLAGGCVRDLLMNRTPNDFDIASNARPEEVEALFPKALTVGREFGVTILPYEGFQVEVATFRKDGAYLDGRRPSSIIFSTPEEDAQRRDFTVNALFYDLKNQKVIDYVGGEADIRAGIIRAVGRPDQRFEEDKLRILRAVRFAAQLGFTIDQETLESVKARHAQVALVSMERVREEMIKLFKAHEAPRGLELMRVTGLMDVVLKEMVSELKREPVFGRVCARLQGGTREPELGWLKLVFDPAEALGDHGPEQVKVMLKRLKCSNREIEGVTWALKMKPLYLDPQTHLASSRRRAELTKALAHQDSGLAERFYSAHEALPQGSVDVWREIHESVLQGQRRLPERLLNGNDLQALGFKKGAELGRLLEEAFFLQLEGKLQSQKEAQEWAQAQLPKA